MRKTILLVAIALVSMIAQAQVLETVSMQQINTVEGKVVGISPKGDYLLQIGRASCRERVSPRV